MVNKAAVIKVHFSLKGGTRLALEELVNGQRGKNTPSRGKGKASTDSSTSTDDGNNEVVLIKPKHSCRRAWEVRLASGTTLCG